MPPALPRTRGRLKNQFIVTFFCIFIFLITYVGYSFFQNSTGAVNPDIARFAIFSYYNLEIYVKNIISWNVPTMDSKTKWKLSKKTPQFDWSNHTGCIALPDSYLLMAMRTPKAASTTLEELISKLSEVNHFVVNKVALLSLNPPGPEESAQMDRVRSYCSYFSSLRKRTVSVAHIRYLDFGANHYPQPFYVGTIRNPVTRMQSHYNYDHFADRPWHISHQERGADTSLRPPTFVECVRAYMNRNNATGEAAGRTKGVGGSGGAMGGMYSCMNQVYLNVQLRYYCGMDPICKRGSLDMILDKALTNLNRQFRVVVVVEEMARSVALLDKLIPSFFGGAKAVSLSLLLSISHFSSS
jgi:hypothetical protein